MAFPSQILISLGSGKPDPSYQEGDPINCYSTARIAHCNLQAHVCNPADLDRQPNGAYPYNSLARRYLDIVCPYRIEQVDESHVRKVARDGSVLDSVYMPRLSDFLKRLKSRAFPKIFGRTGALVWYDRRNIVFTRKTANTAWEMVERLSSVRRAQHLVMRHSPWYRKNCLIVRMPEASSSKASTYIEQYFDGVDDRGKPVLVKKRVMQAHWEEWDLGISPARVRDRQQESVVEDRECADACIRSKV